jgi:hypothetical protein
MATAVCCPAHFDSSCGDGSGATPCCGNGGCNIFCYNCDRGCRSSRSLERDLPLGLVKRADAVETAFIEADTEGAENITLDRYLKYMEVKGEKAVWVKWFEE